MAINSAESCLLFTTASNQLMKCYIIIERRCDDARYDFLICPFHTTYINGLDVCMKKQLVVTCGHDNTI